MDEQSRRNGEDETSGRRASADESRDDQDELSRRRNLSQRPPLTKREREERWPIG